MLVVSVGRWLKPFLLAHELVVSVGGLSKPAVNLLVGGELPVLLACLKRSPEGGTEASPRLRNIPLALALVGPALVWVRSELGVAQDVWMQGLWLQEGCVAQEVWMQGLWLQEGLVGSCVGDLQMALAESLHL